MDPVAWKLFLEAAELGSLSKVAALNGMSQPQVSRIVRELEKVSGGRLLQRTGRGVALSELGQSLTPKIREWLADTEQLANDIRSEAGTPLGRVRIGSLPSTAHPLLTTVFQHVRQNYPRIELSIREGQGAQLDTWLDDGHVDLAILFRMSQRPKNGDVYLSEVPTFLVGAAGDRIVSRPTIDFAKLDGLPLALFCRPNIWRNHLEQLAAERDVSLNVVLEADSLSLQANLAARGNLYALLGPYAVAAFATSCRLQATRLVSPAVTRHIALAMSPRGKSTLATQRVMLSIRDAARGSMLGSVETRSPRV